MAIAAKTMSPAAGAVRAALSAGVRARVAAGVPWTIWMGAAAVTCSTVGGIWDVSWHRSIGRDSFWTPAHMLIYLCAVLAGIVGVTLVTRATWGNDPELRAASVHMLGLRAPLGVFLAGWGGLAMLTSAPFDNWWHNAYGLDVQIVSPPHTVLILGVRSVAVGMTFLILAAMNRELAGGALALEPDVVAAAVSPRFARLQMLFLYLAGLTIAGNMFFLQEFTWDVMLHRTLPYIAMAIGMPLHFAAIREASRFRWAATATAGVYTVLLIAEILILPLFPAQPKLGPVLFPVTHMVPGKFPVLILAPALALDLLWQKARAWKPWQLAAVAGVVFVAVLVAVEWPFAKFLMTQASQNRFFGTGYFQFDSPATSPDRMREFVHPEYGLRLVMGLAKASVFAAISMWAGIGLGRWMRGIQR